MIDPGVGFDEWTARLAGAEIERDALRSALVRVRRVADGLASSAKSSAHLSRQAASDLNWNLCRELNREAVTQREASDRLTKILNTVMT